MNGHRRLRVWQLAGELIDVTYRIARDLPPDERYVAAVQLRRAAWSVQNNIADRHAKLGQRELRKFLDVSLGSLAEVDSMIAELTTMYQLDPETVGRAESLRIH
ncbi:MAG: four helix bundle protein, partial [Gemmatimonadetes bacterium]|nr:four helix bundle protein [Gemmatimonadota bacterium]